MNMIKELNYYLTTNRFSQIAEEIENSVKEYAQSFESASAGNAELREKARIVCEKQMVECGIRDESNSFINIDYEFFDGGELQEANLNRFIKDVLKAHGYQKILWEYMGTTGLMTDISKEKMKEDGFNYEKFLPASLRNNEITKNNNKICRNFNKLKDESGFNWKQGYDPNYTVQKRGWSGAFDENLVWNYYKTDELEIKTAGAKNNVYKIQLVKTEKGCMLYDSQEILLNPIILWYLTNSQEVYGAKQTNTAKIIEDIKEQMKVLGVSKITEVASNGSGENLADYKKLLGKLAAEEVTAVPVRKAEEQIQNNQNAEKISVLQNEAGKLQQKINVMLKANPNLSASAILTGLESDRININIDFENEEDVQSSGVTTEEIQLFREYNKSLGKKESADFKKAVTVLCTNWEQYKSCGKSKIECIESIYDYIKNGKKSVFSYEKSLREVLSGNVEVVNLSLEDTAKKYLPAENLDVALEYIASIPEQSDEKKAAVENSLKNALVNYLTIRSSTGMSIKELFDYSIKSNGGRLPKASFVPPAVGYISPNMQQKSDEGLRQIYFENDIESFIKELCACEYPQKEVLVSSLLNLGGKKGTDVQKIQLNKVAENQMLYDYADEDNLPLIVQMLKERFGGKKYSKLTESDYIEYAERLQSSVNKVLQGDGYKSNLVCGIEPVYMQADIVEGVKKSVSNGTNSVTLPQNYKLAQGKQNVLSGIEQVSMLTSRVNTVQKSDAGKKSQILSSTDKAEVVELLKTLSKTQKEEIIHAAGDESLVTPLLIKEYLWRKENGKSTKNVYADVTSYQSISSMSAADLQTFVTSNAVNAGVKTVSYGGKSGVPVVKLHVENGGQSHINVDEPYSMSEELREAMQKVADGRKMNVEDSKMARINANYEHDKAVLAKTDPAFAAKNQFWDVGHAEESGELSERDVEKLSKLRSNDKIQIINKERE